MQKLLETIKEAKPTFLLLRLHHFVWLSELDFIHTGLKKRDVSSVLLAAPAGGDVPAVCKENLKRIFPNLKVGRIYTLVLGFYR